MMSSLIYYVCNFFVFVNKRDISSSATLKLKEPAPRVMIFVDGLLSCSSVPLCLGMLKKMCNMYMI